MKSKVTTGTSGIIFDMDGVISDTQDLHAEIESSVLKRFGINLSPDEITARFAGVGDKVMFSTLFSEHGVKIASFDDLVTEKWGLMAQAVASHGVKPIAYSLELIELLSQYGFVLSVASGSPRAFIAQVIETFSLQKYFVCCVSGEEVRHGKPAPDIFLEAAKLMGLDYDRCAVIEDGLSGMQAAARAGMGCIGLVKDLDKKYPASVLVTSLREVTPELALSVMGSLAPLQ